LTTKMMKKRGRCLVCERRRVGAPRALQRNWDRIITARAGLQGLAVAALCVTLLI
jgi:hypothetical protein